MANKIKDLFKPKWQNSNPRTRAWAVANMDDPKLLEAIREIAANDDDEQVRLQAAKRIDDFNFILNLSENDAGEQVRDYAKKWIRTQLSNATDESPNEASYVDFVKNTQDLELLEYLSKQAKQTAIRGAAQSRQTRQGSLGDLVLNEKNPELRRAALQRITQKSTLERIQKACRRSDKQFYRLATEMIEALDGDTRQTNEHKSAETLCEQLEQLQRSVEPAEEKETQLEAIQAAWDQLSDDAKQGYEERFKGGNQILQRILKPVAEVEEQSPQQRALRIELDGIKSDSAGLGLHPELSTVQGLIDRAEGLRNAVMEMFGQSEADELQAVSERLLERRHKLLEQQPVSPELLKLCERVEKISTKHAKPRQLEELEKQWQREWQKLSHYSANDQAVEQRFNSALNARQSVLEEQQQRRDQALQNIDTAVEKLEAEIGTGELAASAKAQQSVLDLLNQIGSHPKVNNLDFKARLNTARGKLHELREWQHWSNNKIRTRLCEQAEAIPGSGMHPDAVAEKIKTLRNRWKALTDSERLPGDHPKKLPSPGLYRRFQAACNKAFKPAQGYFEKRAEVRQSHLEEMNDIVNRLDAACADNDLKEVKQLERLIRESRKALRGLNQIPPKERGPMSKRLRHGAQTLDDRLEEEYQVVERRKKRLIEEVLALKPEAGLDAAVAAAKEAQRKWQAVGHARRNREQALWKEFRAASDPIFAHLTEKRNEENAEHAAKIEQFRDLIGELESAIKLSEKEPDQAQQQARRIADQWRQVGGKHQGLERQYQQLSEQLGQQIERSRRRQVAEQRQKIYQLHELCCQQESQRLSDSSDPSVTEQWQMQSEGLKIPAGLASRWESANNPDTGIEASDENLETAMSLCIQAEFLASVETPEPHQQQRMDYQVRRLSERMSGGDAVSTSEEMNQLEDQWFACGPLTDKDRKEVEKRFNKAIKAIQDA